MLRFLEILKNLNLLGGVFKFFWLNDLSMSDIIGRLIEVHSIAGALPGSK
jgi:hypothetical protein